MCQTQAARIYKYKKVPIHGTCCFYKATVIAFEDARTYFEEDHSFDDMLTVAQDEGRLQIAVVGDVALVHCYVPYSESRFLLRMRFDSFMYALLSKV